MKRIASLFLPALVLGPLAMAGCGSTSSEQSSTQSQTTKVGNVTKINGKVPPGRPTAPNEVRVLSEINPAGQEIQVFRSRRNAGTRAPIHTHPYGGVTCVKQGEMTLLMEGDKPFVAQEGECYWMPPGRAMSAANTGGTNSVTLDYFTTPRGKPVWNVVEKDEGRLQKEFGYPAGN